MAEAAEAGRTLSNSGGIVKRLEQKIVSASRNTIQERGGGQTARPLPGYNQAMSSRSSRVVLGSCTAAALVLVALSTAACSGPSPGTLDEGPCGPDDVEATASAPRDLGSFQDDAEFQKEDEGGKSRTIRATLHDGANVDHYVAEILDLGLSGNPTVFVNVTAGFRVTGRFTCRNGGLGKTSIFSCGPGILDRPDAAGSPTTCQTASDPPQFTLQLECEDTSTEDGTLELTVERDAPREACERYRLSVSVE